LAFLQTIEIDGSLILKFLKKQNRRLLKIKSPDNTGRYLLVEVTDEVVQEGRKGAHRLPPVAAATLLPLLFSHLLR
jgi:hypothetical protein